MLLGNRMEKLRFAKTRWGAISSSQSDKQFIVSRDKLTASPLGWQLCRNLSAVLRSCQLFIDK